MARRSAYLDRLAAVPLFSTLSKRDLAEVARAADQIDVPAGRAIVTQGRVGHEFFLILNGRATVRRNNRRVARLGPGQYFGELALLHRGPRSATVVADTDMTVLVLGQREFAGLLDIVPGLAPKLLGGLAQRIREADAKAVTY